MNLLSRKAAQLYKGIQETFLPDTNASSIDTTTTSIHTLGFKAPTMSTFVQRIVRDEEPASCVLLNAQEQAPDIPPANVEEKATCFRRATDSMESLNDPAPAAESSPWRQAS